jgi:hypothetical protein
MDILRWIRLAVYITILVILGVAVANAATLNWSAPDTYTDGTPIGYDEANQLVYHPYHGPTIAGPWTALPTTGAEYATVPEAQSGETMCYTVSALITTIGPEGDKATPICDTVPFPQATDPAAPSGLWLTR